MRKQQPSARPRGDTVARGWSSGSGQLHNHTCSHVFRLLCNCPFSTSKLHMQCCRQPPFPSASSLPDPPAPPVHTPKQESFPQAPYDSQSSVGDASRAVLHATESIDFNNNDNRTPSPPSSSLGVSPVPTPALSPSPVKTHSLQQQRSRQLSMRISYPAVQWCSATVGPCSSFTCDGRRATCPHTFRTSICSPSSPVDTALLPGSPACYCAVAAVACGAQLRTLVSSKGLLPALAAQPVLLALQPLMCFASL